MWGSAAPIQVLLHPVKTDLQNHPVDFGVRQNIHHMMAETHIPGEAQLQLILLTLVQLVPIQLAADRMAVLIVEN